MFSLLRKLTLPLATIAAVEIWVLMLGAGATRIEAGVVSRPSGERAAQADAAPAMSDATAQDETVIGTETLTARRIAPDQFGYAAVKPGDTLERIGARVPLTPPPEKATDAAGAGIPRPNAIAAGIIGTPEGPVRLWGIIPTDPDRRCRSGPDDWPCGMMARTAMRMFMRNRTVDCGDPIETAADGMPIRRCKLAGQDIAAWLAQHGWAEASDGSPYKTAADAARDAGLGLYGDDARQ
ncbi:thermonuclease family protein [Rhizobium sp. PAMB 3174]